MIFAAFLWTTSVLTGNHLIGIAAAVYTALAIEKPVHA